jgi:dipeptidyl aminopeptidase/acylaminoacyl peptidase
MTDFQPTWPVPLQNQVPLITEVALSPDGKKVIFTQREPLLTNEKSAFITHLYAVDVNGGPPRQLTFGEHSNSGAQWSPDGQYVAFLSDRHGEKKNIYAMRPTGGEAWALTAYEKTNITNLRWSPAGDHIVFLMPEPPTEEKEKAEKVGNDPQQWDVDFDFQHLYTVPFAVGPRTLPEVQQVTTGRFHVLSCAWLPNGRELIFTHRPTPYDETWPASRLARTPAFPQSAQDIDDCIDIALLADWQATPILSPDGRWIACAAGEPPYTWAFANRIWIFPADGQGEAIPLAPTPDRMCTLIGWSADSQQVYVGEYLGLGQRIIALPVGGGQPVDMTPAGLAKLPADANQQGKLAFVTEDFSLPPTLTFLDPAGENHEKAIYTVGLPAGWPEQPLPQIEGVTWTAPDGMAIEGYLVYPLDYEPGRKYPLLLEVHGGPQGVYSRYYPGTSVRYVDVLGLSERGFFILRGNPRGSVGYGAEFRHLNRRDWGGGDYQDLMSGVDALIERGLVDPARLGVMGWSYGGFMTSWIITQTGRFKAACVGAGVTNLMSFNGTADIPSFVPDYFAADYWEDPDIYHQHSAMFQVKGVTTPTLIQHGADDIRVPLSQGKELYNALKRQGVPVEMIIYPRQPHTVEEPRLLAHMKDKATSWLVRWVLNQ